MAEPSSVDGNSSITRVGWSGFSSDDDEDDDVDDDSDDNVVVVVRFFGGLPRFGLSFLCIHIHIHLTLTLLHACKSLPPIFHLLSTFTAVVYLCNSHLASCL